MVVLCSGVGQCESECVGNSAPGVLISISHTCVAWLPQDDVGATAPQLTHLSH